MNTGSAASNVADPHLAGSGALAAVVAHRRPLGGFVGVRRRGGGGLGEWKP